MSLPRSQLTFLFTDIGERTDRTQNSMVDAIGEDLAATVAQLDAWSSACIEAGFFPRNIYKRAAG